MHINILCYNFTFNIYIWISSRPNCYNKREITRWKHVNKCKDDCDDLYSYMNYVIKIGSKSGEKRRNRNSQR